MYITDDIKYIGINDKTIDIFESLYPVPSGIAYNSYVILDNKVAVMDTMDQHYSDEWLKELDKALDGRNPDYLVVHHMEPDHSATIKIFMDKYPKAVLVSNKQSFAMINNLFGTEYEDRRIMVGEKSELELGKHKLVFFTAPMVHWPEVVVSYMPDEKILFSADAFGKFGSLDIDMPWEDEAARYFFSIVGKFGVQAGNLLKKLEGIEVNTICALHGPVLKENIGHYVDLYKTWASYEPEKDGICICYCSVYGHTKDAVEKLAKQLISEGKDVKVYDLARCDMFAAVTDAFRYSRLLLASTTYYGEVFPFMREFIQRLRERNFQKRKVYLVENGMWMPVAAKRMAAALDGLDIIIDNQVSTIKGSSDEDITINW